ncbi:MAG: DUF4920 domain-containing protein [Bacteroidia bacterium]|jgi:hypothetical protein
MKNNLMILVLALTVCACNSSVGQQRSFGEKVDPSAAIPMGEMLKQIQGKEQLNATVEGKVSSVCQAKGCWMKLETGTGETIRVTFKDYGFFVPKDLAGSTVYMKGEASVKVTSVEELRHYAEDAKKSKEEIEKITEPKRELVFEADGVLIK